MVRVWVCLALAASWARAANFELIGQLEPEQGVVVYLHGATMPFRATAEADLNGRFRFRRLPAGTYVLMVGALQRTVEVGPSLADAKHRVKIRIRVPDQGSGLDLPGANRVSIGELSIPKDAQNEYEEAEKALGHRDVPAAVAHLRRAVEIAPSFAAAWNHLGTIAYQTGQYVEAEADFGQGLAADPEAYAPLVNLGGVLLSLGKWNEALAYNRRAVQENPNDALANSQLGMAYFYSGQMDPAEKYLTAAKRIDPSHFSHPQLLLAEIYLRRSQPGAAADELQDLLNHHPDLANASKIRQEIARLRAESHQ